MSNIEDLVKKYGLLLRSTDPMEEIFDFKEVLLSCDSLEFLQFHFDIINDERLPNSLRMMIKSFFWAKALNERDSEKVSDFLLEKYNRATTTILKADILQMLGHLRSKYAKGLAYQNIDSNDRNLRYKSIIVLGWVGGESELEPLNNSLLNDADSELRCFSATAMRQIWCNHIETKDAILLYLKNAIVHEDVDNALIGIIITVQDLLNKKLGVKESNNGDVSGDLVISKAKTINVLSKYFND